MESVIFYVRKGVEKTATIASRRVPNLLSVKFAVISKELSLEPSPPSLDGIGTLNEMLELLDIVITDVQPKRLLVKPLARSFLAPPED